VSRIFRLEAVTLREQLEAAHQKIETQRQELQNVADRMQDHSGRLMELLAAGEDRHAQELREQKVFYERLLGGTQKTCNGRIADVQMKQALHESGERSKAAVTREEPDTTEKMPRITISKQPETTTAHKRTILFIITMQLASFPYFTCHFHSLLLYLLLLRLSHQASSSSYCAVSPPSTCCYCC